MRKTFLAIGGTLIWLGSGLAPAASEPNSVEVARYQAESSRVHAAWARMGDRTGLGVFFQGTQDLHFYARSETAPAPGLHLQVTASGPGLTFGEPVFPPWKTFKDPGLGQDVEVYVGDFQVFIPLAGTPADAGPADVNVQISGLACTSQVCLAPFTEVIRIPFNPKAAEWLILAEHAPGPTRSADQAPQATAGGHPVGYLLLALLAGLSINLMPCVLPVIPLIILRLVKQSQQAGRARLVSGAAFCLGIVAFFAAFAVLSAVLNRAFGMALDLNSLFRYPAVVMALFLGIVLFALVMLDVAPLTLPSSVAGRETSGLSLAGSFGTGFSAAVLSIPCSGALLGFVLVWAQTQPWAVSSLSLVLMGLGMALPYAVLILVPGLLDRVPKPGRWMEVFKKSCGFLLLLIAVKLTLAALPKDRLIDLLAYGVVFSFCVWMWGQWVDAAAPAARRWAVRLAALALAAGTGLALLPAPAAVGPRVAWEAYDAQRVEQAKAEARPVLLKFTADWCTNCKVVERRVYEDRQVVDLIGQKGVLAVRADTTSFDSPATRDFKQVYGEAGNVPVTILLIPGRPAAVLRGIFDRSRLLDLLKDLPGGQT